MMQWQCGLREKQAGFSMIELLVGTAIGILLLAVVLVIASNSGAIFRASKADSQLQDNGLFAMQYLARAIRGAGFFGCNSQKTAITNNLNSSSSGYNATLYDFIGNGISGTHGITGPFGSLPGTDTITVKGAATQGSIALVAPYVTGSSIYISSGNNLQQGQIILVSDCQAGDIVQISNNPSAGVIAHNNGGGAGVPGNATSSLSKNYTSGAYVYNINSDTFSIQTGANGRPSLFISNSLGTTELVPGIENLQVTYGEDTDADGIANHYVTADNVTNMGNVVSVRLALVSVSNDDQLAPTIQSYQLNGSTVTPTDKRLRRVYTSTIGLRNQLA